MTNEEFSSFERELRENGKVVYTNVGVSMMPLIREKHDVLVFETYRSDPKKHDVVLFVRDGVSGRGKYVAHRILKIRKDGTYFIAGDHDTSGEIVERSHILGVLTMLTRDGKKLDFNGFRYRAYVHLWCAPYHLRFFFVRTVRKIKYLFSAVRSKLFGK